MKKTTALIIAVLVTVGAIVFGVAQSQAATNQPSAPYWVTRACPAEDSDNCYWDAEVRGTRTGKSFITRAVPNSNGLKCIFFTDLEFAKTNDRCFR